MAASTTDASTLHKSVGSEPIWSDAAKVTPTGRPVHQEVVLVSAGIGRFWKGTRLNFKKAPTSVNAAVQGGGEDNKKEEPNGKPRLQEPSGHAPDRPAPRPRPGATKIKKKKKKGVGGAKEKNLC